MFFGAHGLVGDPKRFGATAFDLSQADDASAKEFPLSLPLNDLRLDVDAFAGAAHPDGFAIGYATGRVVITDPALQKPLNTFTADAAAIAVAVSPNGRSVASAHADGAVYVWTE